MSNNIDIDEIRSALEAHDPNTSHSENAKRHAAVAMVLSPHEERGLSALFIKRADHPNDPWSGHMAMPGGRHEPEDESLQHAAIRETSEEVGVTLTDDMCIGRLHDLYGGRLKEHRMAVSAFVFHCPELPAVTPNEEVAETVWVPIEFMRHPSNTSPYTFHLDPEKREYPSFVYDDYTIWGLTFRILANFYQVLGIEHPDDPRMTDAE